MEIRRPITHHLLSAVDRPKSWVALRFKRHKDWLELNWKDYFATAEAVGLGLASLGVKRGDRVAILANTRWEWAALDFGILGLGAVTIPIYQSNKADEIEFVLLNATPRVLVVEDSTQLRKWETIAKKCKSVEAVVCIQPGTERAEDGLSWDDLLNRGVQFRAGHPDYFRQEIEKTKLGEMATVVYTSGTTGDPKGAVLTHEQILSEVEDITRAFPISPEDSTLSFLPYAHVLGRVELWLHTYVGFTLNFAESIDRLKSNLEQTRPTVMIGVPRIFEKIYAGLLTQIEGNPVRKHLFGYLSSSQNWAAQLVADRLLYRRLREGLGGRLRFVVSGGAPLDKQLGDFFRRAGLLLLEGYGLTETTGCITVNTPDAYEFGTVGKPLADVKLKIASDGEILVQSKKTFTKYYNEPAGSSEAAFIDGYFATGDIGEITDKGFLRITDRKKDLIKTAGGKYVAPQKIECMLKLNPLISQVLVHGDRRKYVVALATLNESYLKSMAREKSWTYRDYRALTQLPEVGDMVRKVVADANAQLASYETIKNFAILPEDFSLERGELTPSLKVKRRVLDEKYKAVSEDLYR